ncbi:MAG TPA: hypothetical protein VHG30_15345, partial [Microvirga sp.]|nr:hypothetical protein [Microvirga sp.]
MTSPGPEGAASIPTSDSLSLGTAPAAAAPTAAPKAASPLRAAWDEFKENRIAVAALAVVLAI